MFIVITHAARFPALVLTSYQTHFATGTWGLPKDKKEVKEVKRSVKKDEPKDRAMLWGIHSVSELEATMGLE
jgi:hypothetical protein